MTRTLQEQLGQVEVATGKVTLLGNLIVPAGAGAVVLFAHGSGSGRLSPRNQAVASTLREKGLATLLFDLLTQREEERDEVTRELRFDIDLLAERLVGATDWLLKQPQYARLRVGYFGASTGAAAALVAAARRPEQVQAVVSRGGRPDMAGMSLPQVKAPTLLIVGGRDYSVIDLNQAAQKKLTCENELKIVPCATHLFEELGTLEEVAQLAADWFAQHLMRARPE